MSRGPTATPADAVPDDGIAPGEMPLSAHLAELRQRVVRVAFAVVAGTVVGFIFFDEILSFLMGPYCDVDSAFRPAGPSGDCQLVALNPLDPFSVRFKTAGIVGLFLGGPVIFFQLWRFVAPGLTAKEKKYSAPFVVLSQLMFTLGVVFAYLIIPQGLRILIDFGGPGIVAVLTAREYLDFILTTSVAFGIVFETPLLLVFLSLVGIVSSQGLRRFRPYAIVLNAVVAAVVTPTTDAVTMFFMAVPMVLFYEIAIVAAMLIERSRRKRAAA